MNDQETMKQEQAEMAAATKDFLAAFRKWKGQMEDYAFGGAYGEEIDHALRAIKDEIDSVAEMVQEAIEEDYEE